MKYCKDIALAQRPPIYLRKWLLSSGSLTQQLTMLAKGQFSVKCTREQYRSMSLSESQWLRQPAQHLAWVREVDLFGCEQQAWVKAKSIFPMMSLQKQARQFQQLRNRPIGALLFYRTQPICERRVLYLPDGWTRQSRYIWKGCPFIIQETFLPSFEQFILCQH